MQAIRADDLRKTFRVLRGRDTAGRRAGGLFTRSYAPVEAVAGVSFAIEQGQIVGYLGPNTVRTQCIRIGIASVVPRPAA